MGQGIADLEHIVIDGGSTDGTQDILRCFPHVRWLSEPDTGQSHALNKGFRLARADVVGWLNVDDSYPPGSLRAALDYLRHHPDCDVLHGDCLIVNPDGSLVSTSRGRVVGPDDLLRLPIHTPAVFFRRRVFDRIGYLDERLHYVMDNQFLIRAAPGSQFCYLARPLARFTLQPDSKSMGGLAPFALETIGFLEELRQQEPYRSGVPAAVWRREFARLHWMAAVGLAETGAAAATNARAAIDDYDALIAYPDLIAEGLTVRFVERQVRARAEIPALIERLTPRADERRQMAELTDRQYTQLAFMWAYKRQDWPAVYRLGREALARGDVLLRRRGFWPIWARSVISLASRRA